MPLNCTVLPLATSTVNVENPVSTLPLPVILRGGVVPIRARDPRLPAAVAEVVDRAVVDAVPERYQTAGEFRDVTNFLDARNPGPFADSGFLPGRRDEFGWHLELPVD